MNVEVAKVEKVDRVNQIVYCQGIVPPGEGGQPTRYEAKYLGDPPWPLASVDLQQISPGKWRCEGPIGHRQVVLHEDFGFYFDSGNNALQHFDHPWQRHRPAAAGSLSVGSGGFTDPTGIVFIQAGPTAGQYINIRRADVLTSAHALGEPRALWMSAAVQLHDPSDRIYQVAFSNAAAADFNAGGAFGAGDIFAGFRSDTSSLGGNWVFTAARDGSLGALDTGMAPDPQSIDILDVLVLGGVFAVGWITRIFNIYDQLRDLKVAGPYIIEPTGFDATLGHAVAPTIGVYPRVSDIEAPGMSCSFVHIESVGPVVHPSRDLVTGGSGLPL